MRLENECVKDLAADEAQVAKGDEVVNGDEVAEDDQMIEVR